ncbi:MAG TPA: hypothetical protein VF796_21420 [Humisphaera sp.]
MPPTPKTRRPPRQIVRRVAARERRYPIWSVRAVVLSFLLGLIVTGAVVAIAGPKGVMHKLELVVGVFALGLFAFLALGLYYGARVRKQEDVVGELKAVSPGDVTPSNLNIGDLNLSDSGDDIFGCLFGLVAGILLFIFAVVAIIVFANVAVVLFFVLSATLGWAFQRALRQVFKRSRRCRGDWAASLAWAGWYTFLYTGWLALALAAGEYLVRRHRGG